MVVGTEVTAIPVQLDVLPVSAKLFRVPFRVFDVVSNNVVSLELSAFTVP